MISAPPLNVTLTAHPKPANYWQGVGQVMYLPKLMTIAPPHCLRFQLQVRSISGRGLEKIHVFPVREYGLKGHVDYYYLRPEAWVYIEGHLESDVEAARPGLGRRAAEVVIVADFVALGEGCDLANGRRKMAELIDVEQERGNHVEEQLQLARKFTLMLTPPPALPQDKG